MPELPEVNTLVAALNRQLTGDSFKCWHRLAPRLRVPIPGPEDIAPLIGRPICAVRRVAKSIFFDFGQMLCLHVHLGMTGFFRLAQNADSRLKHEHLRIELTGGRILSFYDPRRFGIIDLRVLPENPVVEPLDEAMTAEFLFAAASGRRVPIKGLLMDQKIIAGLGNIYAGEALFEAGILPFRSSNSLSFEDVRCLVDAIRRTVEAAVNAGLTSLSPAFRVNAATTHFPVTMKVYGETGQPCPRCRKTVIRREVICGRSSFYCPECQR